MLGLGRIALILKKMGLKKHRYTAAYIPLGQQAANLQREGRSYDWIAQCFNEQAFPSPSGKPWSHCMVEWLLQGNSRRARARALKLNQENSAAEKLPSDRGQRAISAPGGVRLNGFNKNASTKISDLAEPEELQ